MDTFIKSWNIMTCGMCAEEWYVPHDPNSNIITKNWACPNCKGKE
jgi:hypothetical protein